MKTKTLRILLTFMFLLMAMPSQTVFAADDSTAYQHGKLFPNGNTNAHMVKNSSKEDYGSIDFRISNYTAYVIYTKLGTTKISDYSFSGTLAFYPFNYSDYESKKANADYKSRYNCITQGLSSRTKNFAGTWWVAVIDNDNFSACILVNGGTKKTVDGTEISPFADFAAMDKGMKALANAYAYENVSDTEKALCQKLGTYFSPASSSSPVTTNKGLYFYYPASFSKERDKVEDVTDTKYTVLAKKSIYSVTYKKDNVYWNEDGMATTAMARSYARFTFVLTPDGTHKVTLPISFHTGLIRNSTTTPAQCDSRGLAVCTKNYILADAESNLAITMVKNPNNHNTDKGMTYVKDTNNGTADEPWHIKKRLCCGDIIKHERCELKETKAATCTATGTLECSLCHQTKTIPAIGHNMTHHEAIEATCTEAGQKEYWECSNCNKKFADANGTQVLTSVTVNKLGHDFTAEVEDEQYIKTVGNCTRPNTYYRCCSRCGEKGTTSFTGSQAAGHNLEFHEGTPATCTESGTIDYYECSECGKKMTEDNPQCTTYITNIIAPKVSHDYSGSEVSDEYLKSEATCTKPAVYYHCCTMCGAKGTSTFEDGEALGHTYEENEDDWVVTNEPTCTSVGSKVGTCTRCSSTTTGHTKTEVIPKIDHEDDGNYVTVTEPTCTKDGTECTHCTMCGKVMDTQTIYSTGHVLDAGSVIKEPTCTESGLGQGKCSVCGMVLENYEIPAKRHSFEREHTDYTVVKEPTCSEKGSKQVVCEDCGYVKTEEIPVDETKHIYDCEVVKEATCIHEGERKYTCTGCNYTFNEIIPVDASHHNWNEGEILSVPTTTKTGVKVYTCLDCGVLRAETLPKSTNIGDDSVKYVEIDKVLEEIENSTTLTIAEKRTLKNFFNALKQAGVTEDEVTKNGTKMKGELAEKTAEDGLSVIESISSSDANPSGGNNNDNPGTSTPENPVETGKTETTTPTQTVPTNVPTQSPEKTEDISTPAVKQDKPIDTSVYQALTTVKTDNNGFINGQSEYIFESDKETFKLTYKNGVYKVLKYDDGKWIDVPTNSSTTSNSSVYTYNITTNPDGTKSIQVLKNKKLVIKKVSLKSVKFKKSKKAIIKFAKVKGVSGYEVKISTSKKFTKKTSKSKSLSVKKTSYTFAKLKTNKVYYAKVRAYKKVNGKKVYGKWSNVKKVKIKS